MNIYIMWITFVDKMYKFTYLLSGYFIMFIMDNQRYKPYKWLKYWIYKSNQQHINS